MVHSDNIAREIVPFVDVSPSVEGVVTKAIDVGGDFNRKQDFDDREIMLTWIRRNATNLGFGAVIGRSDNGQRIYIHGMCHWVGLSNTYPDGSYLVSFNLSDEIFITTLIPFSMDAKLKDKDWSTHLILLNGSIATISWYHGSGTFHISVLGELGVKESWIKLFNIELLLDVDHPIGVGKEGNIFFRKKDDELILFDLRTQMIRELGIKGWHFSQVVIYKECFIPIGGINL
ncbi:uncharacterized protein LOC131632632 [Vicia villosa]|uniref:uncharacterized protein LOC131632632 n=1 Tax=Vicia villosa TaxID=3911 RepID=UPI00273ACA2A|nr:uncharacterized protein LOC131632632 [Vicia villosa]